MATKVGSTNPQDDLPGTTKGGVPAGPPMPILNPPTAGTDPMLNHPHLEVAQFDTGADPGT